MAHMGNLDKRQPRKPVAHNYLGFRDLVAHNYLGFRDLGFRVEGLGSVAHNYSLISPNFLLLWVTVAHNYA